MVVMGIIVGYCEYEKPEEHVVVRGGTYRYQDSERQGYGVYVNGLLARVIPMGQHDMALCYLAARKIAINYKNCARVDQIAVGQGFFKVISRVADQDRSWWAGWMVSAEESVKREQNCTDTDAA